MMQFKVTKRDLSKALHRVVNATTLKSTLPILSNILIEGQKSKLLLLGTDLEIAIQTEIGAQVSEPGSITIPGRKFYDIVRELPEAEILVTVRKNNLVTIECEKSYFKIMGLPKDDFPKLPEFKSNETLVTKQQVLKEMLDITSFAVSTDETRYVLNGVLCLVKDKELKFVATDGRRLSVVKRREAFPEGVEKQIILPGKTVNELSRILGDEGDLKIWFGENQARFDFDHTRLYSRLIEGQFPNYEQVIPKNKGKVVRIRREEFLLALKRVSLVSGSSQPVKIELAKNRLMASAQSSELGEAREEVAAKYSGEGVVAGFNPHYIMDALKNIELDEISLELESSEKPGVIRTGDDYLYVIMPMQLS